MMTPFSSESPDDANHATSKRCRRRVTAEQAVALQHSFQDDAHPTREVRVALASQLDMELRAVNIWFQNKRQAMKRKIKQSSTNENERNKGHFLRRRHTLSVIPSRERVVAPTTSSVSTRTLRATNSLNLIPGHTGRFKAPSKRSLEDAALSAGPSTPRKATGAQWELWDHMLSSPPSQTSPSRARIPSLATRRADRRSLEWACAHSTIVESDREECLPELDQDTDVEEPSGSETTMELSTPDSSLTDISFVGEGGNARPKEPAKEMEAAMVLLNFKRR